MTLLETLRKDKMTAMKEKDAVKSGVLGLLISTANLKTKELHRDLTKEEEMSILSKELKQTHEALASIPASREDLIAETKAKIQVIESYLPKQLSLAEVKEYIIKKIETMKANGEEVPELSPKNYNRMIMTELAGQADGKLVAQAVTELSKEI
ncbi:MAG: GatB/YqeY domain-containing protein [Erysipelotrichales bacterium]|nr:GatB/YqeY domain-containing protein [Erysipelotrichales bacterium]